MRAMRTLLVVGLLSVTVVRAFASQVVPMSIEQLADHSGEVIVGTVANVTSQWRENPRRIESLVTFEGVSLLKGDRTLPDNKFTLTVPGGSVGEFQMRVCCAPEFAVGDKWVLMLLPTYKTYPVVGIYRGALRIVEDGDGVERVYNAAGRSVTGFDESGHFVIDGKAQRHAAEHLVAENGAHVRAVAARESSSIKAMRLTEFVDTLTPVLAASRKHSMDRPAGTPVRADLSPVTLKQSPMARSTDNGGDSPHRELPRPAQAGADPRKVESKKEVSR